MGFRVKGLGYRVPLKGYMGFRVKGFGYRYL